MALAKFFYVFKEEKRMDITTKNFLKGEFEELKKEFKKNRNVQDIVDHLCVQFLEAGVKDFDTLLEMMSSDSIYYHHDALVEKGAKIDFKRMLGGLSPQLVANQVNKLLLWGCDPDDLVDRMYTKDIEENIILLMDSGATAEKIVTRLDDDGEKSFLFWNRELFEAYYSALELYTSKSKFKIANA